MNSATSLIIGFIAGLMIGIILVGYARAESDKCAAVSKAYELTAPQYRSQIGLNYLPGLTLYEHESLGMDRANEVAEAWGVVCMVKPIFAEVEK